ncbi:MAG TPA: ankyrin repeat domain-containing protein [Steroidobacteraceae bacterium]
MLSLGAAGFSAAASGGPQSLVDLIRSGQREAVLAAITSPAVDVNAAEPDGTTPLLYATYTVDHEMVRALLKRGAKANVTNNYGSSPLTEAVKLGDLDLVQQLLNAHADANSPNQDGETALMLASNVGSLKIAQLLIAKGANVNAVETFRGQNALMWAAAQDHPDIVDLLLAHHAEVARRAKADDWPRQMTSEPRAQFRQTGGLTALLYAIRSGCTHCAEAIVKAGADVNQPTPDGITPLIDAIDNRSFDIAMFLLDKGANPSTWDMSGRTPLYVAVDMNSYHGRGFGGPTGFAGYPTPTAAHPAQTAHAMDLVNRLLGIGVDANHQLTRMRPNGNGRGRFEDYMMRGGTGPLMIAAMSHDDVAIKALLAHGAEVDLPNVFQITPLMAAVGMSGSGRAGFGPPERDAQERVIETVDLLLQAGADVNARVTNSHTHTAKLVAYVQGRDHEGQTTLFPAAEEGWDKVVKHLLDCGADATLRDDTGKTALDFARSPPVGRRPAPAAAAGARAGGGGEAAGRAETIALLEAAMSKSGAGAGAGAGAGGAGQTPAP